MADYFWIDVEQARACADRVSLAAFGALNTVIAITFIDRKAVPFDSAAGATMLDCTESEWQQARDELIAAGELTVIGDEVMPASAWAKPEADS
jgi:hypothetical protein